jgi:HEXXH motif-containing protein
MRHYSPWASSIPLTRRIAPELLGAAPVEQRGGLLTDGAYLRVVRDFLTGQPYLDEIDGVKADWLPSPRVDERTKAVFDGGRDVLLSAHPSLRRLYESFIDYVVPLEGEVNRGYSNHLARGIIFRTFPSDGDAYDVAIDLAHELGHNVFFVWQSTDTIMDPVEHGKPVYSASRGMLRPAIQTFHGAVALAFMLFIVNALPDDPKARAAGVRRGERYGSTLPAMLDMTLRALDDQCTLTPLGRHIFEEMAALL